MSTVADACRGDGPDTLLSVRVQPGARRDGPGELRTLPPVGSGRERTVIVWRVRARAVDGKANAALVRAVADHIGVPPSAVEIVRGQRAREKVLRIRDCAVSQVTGAFTGHPRG
jgi:hypothetical protein